VVEQITSAGLHAALDTHDPDICSDGHFVCECGWHEVLPEDPIEIQAWAETWRQYIDHLTQGPQNKEELN
jgi:hypothetical protein